MSKQIAATNAILVSGGDTVLVVGDKTRQGVIRPAPVVRESSERLVGLAWGAWRTVVAANGRRAGFEFKKQVIAALDERTTETCLKVHGQIRNLDEPFKLVGTPRFADEIEKPPFHWYCRTAIALYLPEFDLGLTQEMEHSAIRILEERQAGGTGFRHPASALAS